MDSSEHKFMPVFCPNNCLVCRTTKNLKRCSRCQMISYCGSDHQKEHWPFHKEICKQISIILKERRVSHIYEGLRGADPDTWRQVKCTVYRLVESKLGRALYQQEGAMLLSPRTCLVCHEAEQEKVKKCSGCPYATFCSAHPSSSSHDEICSLINDKYEFQTRVGKFQILTVAKAIQTIVVNTRVHKSLKLPTSVSDYLHRYSQTPVTMPEDLKIYTSIYFTKPLTLFNALQKLNYNPGLKMVLHILAQCTPFEVSFYWEALLHLLPNLINLKIILYEPAEDIEHKVNLCKKCRSMKKTLVLECVSDTSAKYGKYGSCPKADFVAVYNYDPLQTGDPLVSTRYEPVKNFDFITCPWLLTTVTEKKAKAASEQLRSNSKNVEICYDGKNDFASIKPEINWENEGISLPNQFLMVMRPRDN